MGTREMPLSRGKVALVDAADYEWLSQWKWYYLGQRTKEYAYRFVRTPEGQKSVYMHREVMSAPAGQEIDHIDGNGLNNTRANLRACTRSENARNHRKRRKSVSPYIGVSWNRRSGKWAASVSGLHLGNFDTPEEAALVRDQEARKRHGEFVVTNSQAGRARDMTPEEVIAHIWPELAQAHPEASLVRVARSEAPHASR